MVILVFILFLFPSIVFAAPCTTSVNSVPCLLESIVQNTSSIAYSVDVTANGQSVIWSQSMSFLAGLLTASAFVSASLRKW